MITGGWGAGDAAVSSSAKTINRWAAVYRGWQVVNVRRATSGSVVATTSDWLALTISFDVMR